MKYFLLIGILNLCNNLYSQTDTIYLDARLEKTSKDKYRLTREVQPLPNGTYRIIDYHKNKKIRSAGIFNDPNAKTHAGAFILYRPDGSIGAIHDYYSSQKGWLKFYDKNYQLRFKVHCVNGNRHGIALFFDKSNNLVCKGKYKNGKPHKGLIPYLPDHTSDPYYTLFKFHKGFYKQKIGLYSNGKVAYREFLFPTDKTARSIWEYGVEKINYFQKSGKKLGSCIYSKGIPKDGLQLQYYYEMTDFKPAIIRNKIWYKNSKIERSESFSPTGENIGNCTYDNNYPLNGKIIERIKSIRSDKFMLIEYENGIQITSEEVIVDR